MAYYLLSLKKQSYDLAIHDYKKREAGPRATYLEVRDSPINHLTIHPNPRKNPTTQPNFHDSA